MKTLSPSRAFLTLTLFFACLVSRNAKALVYYWDNNGTSAATSGTWDTAAAQWSTTTNLTASTIAWNPTNAACFCAGTDSTGVINITVNTAINCPGIFNGSLKPPGCFLTISGSGSLILPGMDSGLGTGGSDGGTTTIAVPFTGGGPLVLEGSNQVFLAAANTHTGGLALGFPNVSFKGTLLFSNVAVFGSGGIDMSNCSGCTLAVGGTGALVVTNPISAGGTAVNFTNNAPLTFSGGWSLHGALGFGPETTQNLVVLSGVVSGSAGSLGKYNSGSLELKRANTYAGGTIISNGTLIVANTNGSATGAGPVNVTNLTAGALTGNGIVTGIVSVSGAISTTNVSGGTATLTTGPLNMFGGSHYQWAFNNANGIEGGNSGWDILVVNGVLTNDATPGSPWNIDVVSLTPAGTQGVPSGFDNMQDYSWRIIHTTGPSIANFDTSAINITTTSFAPGLGGGNFYVSTNGAGNDIYLKFVHVPVITAVSPSQGVVPGDTATFAVSTPGTVLTSLLTYQWQRDGVSLTDGGEISGSSTATLTITGATDADAGAYTVGLTNIAGGITSTASALVLVEPPLIFGISPVVVNRTNVVFNASIVPPNATYGATYQWSANGTNLSDNAHIAGSVTTNLTLVNATAADLGAYTLLVSNIAGTTFNSGVFAAPVIGSSTGSQSAISGTNVFFTATLSQGTTPVTYQWQENGVNLSDGAGITGSSRATLTVTASDADAGTYNVVVSNPGGQTIGSSAVLTVFDPPQITAEPPVNQTVECGSQATFAVSASGTPPLSFQWNFGGTPILGATASSLTLSPSAISESGGYAVAVTNAYGSAIWLLSTLSVVDTTPPVVTLVGNATTTTAQNSTFVDPGATAVDTCSGNIAVTTSGSVNTSLTGTYVLTYTAVDPSGNSAGAGRTVIVIDPGIISQPMNTTNNTGTTASFTVAVGGTAPFKYQWYSWNGTSSTRLAGQTKETLTFKVTSIRQALGYYVIVADGNGSVTSAIAQLTVYVPPVISVQPANLALVAGNTASFAVVADGTAPLSYQWNFNNSPINAATSSTYTLIDAQTNDSGVYSCTVSNISGVSVTTAKTRGILKVRSDDTKPVVAIAAPKANAMFTPGLISSGGVIAPNFALVGSAADNGLISSVTLQRITPFVDDPVNATLLGTLPGLKTFSNIFTLADGTNTYKVWATDAAGNISVPVTRSFVYVVKSAFALMTNGIGRVTSATGATNRAFLEIGRNYTVTASEARGSNWLFDNWTGGIRGGNLTNFSTNANLTFMMESNLVLQANFVTNPFTPAVGLYNGLFYPETGVTEQSSGFFTLNITETGAYSGKLYLDGVSYPLDGGFDLAGDAAATITRVRQTPLQVTLHLNLYPFDDVISGEVINSDWESDLSGEISLFNGTTVKATNYAARYTMTLTASNGIPGGVGFATIVNNLDGNSLFSGELGDGTPFSQSVQISQFGNVPFYASLYAGKGSIMGWLTFLNTPSNAISGTLNWIKPAMANTVYPGGFTNILVAIGSEYTPPAKGAQILNLTTGILTMNEGGDSGGPLVYNVELSPANLLTNAASTPTNRLSVVFAPTTGAMKIIFQPTGSKKLTVGQGVVLQNQAGAAGWFLLTNTSAWFLSPD